MDILVIIAHPDDEALGLGATIFRHKREGDSIAIMSLTDGVSARSSASESDCLTRHDAADHAATLLGFEWVSRLTYPDNQLDSVPLLEIIREIEFVKSQVKPELLYVHSNSDLNIDHRIASQAALTAFRPESGENCSEIRSFEVSSATDYGSCVAPSQFSPNLFIEVDHDAYLAKKNALIAYGPELKNYPNSRSIEAIENSMRYRGNSVGLIMAEAFEVKRKILGA